MFTTWSVYFIKLCKQRSSRRKRPSLVHMMGLQRAGRLSPRSKMGAKWLAKIKKGQVRPKDSVTLSVMHLSPLGSQLSFNSAIRIENVVDWDSIRKKYLALTGNEPEKEEAEEKEGKGDEDAKEDENATATPNVAALPPTVPTPPM